MRERIVYIWNHIAFFFSTGKKKQALGELLDFQQDLVWDIKRDKAFLKEAKSNLRFYKRLDTLLPCDPLKETRGARKTIRDLTAAINKSRVYFTKAGKAEFMQRRRKI